MARGWSTLTALLASGCGQEVLLAAELDGQLVRAGEPVADVEVARTVQLAWSGNTWTEQATSDADGWFRFGRLTSKLWLGAWLPHTPGIRTTLVVEGREIFDGTKQTYGADGPLGNPLRMRCHLDLEPGASEATLFWSVCEAL